MRKGSDSVNIKPILFNTDMVRAILEGRKTVTRRVVRPLPELDADGRRHELVLMDNKGMFAWKEHPNVKMWANPPYQPGDILYAPETWKCRFAMLDQDGLGYEVVFRDGKIVRFRFDDKKRAKKWAKYARKDDNHWQSPYFMPKEAARIFLRVTGVRVERLRDITVEDAAKDFGLEEFAIKAAGLAPLASAMWNTTIKREDRIRYGWATNPWVWVIEFERCEKPEVWP